MVIDIPNINFVRLLCQFRVLYFFSPGFCLFFSKFIVLFILFCWRRYQYYFQHLEDGLLLFLYGSSFLAILISRCGFIFFICFFAYYIACVFLSCIVKVFFFILLNSVFFRLVILSLEHVLCVMFWICVFSSLRWAYRNLVFPLLFRLVYLFRHRRSLRHAWSMLGLYFCWLHFT